MAASCCQGWQSARSESRTPAAHCWSSVIAATSRAADFLRLCGFAGAGDFLRPTDYYRGGSPSSLRALSALSLPLGAHSSSA
jgi:hypothetical protein